LTIPVDETEEDLIYNMPRRKIHHFFKREMTNKDEQAQSSDGYALTTNQSHLKVGGKHNYPMTVKDPIQSKSQLSKPLHLPQSRLYHDENMSNSVDASFIQSKGNGILSGSEIITTPVKVPVPTATKKNTITNIITDSFSKLFFETQQSNHNHNDNIQSYKKNNIDYDIDIDELSSSQGSHSQIISHESASC
jgi:hypothetical protein